MKILKVTAKNFGSYKEVEYDAADQGLVLIHGATGSGKSTLADIVTWCLYGITTKDTNVGDVCSWETTQGEDTSASVTVRARSGDMAVHRKRSDSAGDVFWVYLDDPQSTRHRGRNAAESQQILSQLLGGEAQEFVSGSFLFEHSRVNAFFLSNAKDRKRVLELVTDLLSAIRIGDRAVHARKQCRDNLLKHTDKENRLLGAVEQTSLGLNRLIVEATSWDTNHQLDLESERGRSEHFEALKASKIAALITKQAHWDAAQVTELDALVAKLDVLQDQHDKAESKYAACTTCGVSKGAEILAEIQGKIERTCDKYQATGARDNPYDDQLARAQIEENRSEERIQDLLNQTNPHSKYLADLQGRLNKQQADLAAEQAAVAEITARISSLDQIYDFSILLRGALLQSSVARLECKTNELLETYFDSEFRVSFDSTDGDSIDVSITKGGYSCVFRQLSKGQRQLLKLCFSLAVMEAVSNTTGVHYDQLFLDEPLDGMDESLKIKAFALLESLAQKHSSVFVIDHSAAFQELFDTKWTTTITSEGSQLEHNA